MLGVSPAPDRPSSRDRERSRPYGRAIQFCDGITSDRPYRHSIEEHHPDKGYMLTSLLKFLVTSDGPSLFTRYHLQSESACTSGYHVFGLVTMFEDEVLVHITEEHG